MKRYDNFIESPFNDWQEIDIIVSRDCTLRCTYCYLQKRPDSIVNIDAMMESLDVVLKEAYDSGREGVVLSFYPEPWVNIERSNTLILRALDKLSKYDRFVANFMIMMSTNGVNLHKPIPVLSSLSDHLSVGVTIDGVKEQHDMYRLFPDGSPSWDIVRRNILDNQSKYNIYSTKVTLGPETLKYAYESSLFLWDEMNMSDINMNVVFEDLWGDRENKVRLLTEFEKQLSLISDDIMKNKRWEKRQYQGLLGTRNLPSHWIDGQSNPIAVARTYCGAGQMRSIDSDGGIYPCFRMSPYALQENKKYNLYREGNEVGRAVNTINNVDSVSAQCKDCEILEACPMCVGGAVEENGSLFYRTTHHCEFQKLMSMYSLDLYRKINEVSK